MKRKLKIALFLMIVSLIYDTPLSFLDKSVSNSTVWNLEDLAYQTKLGVNTEYSLIMVEQKNYIINNQETGSIEHAVLRNHQSSAIYGSMLCRCKEVIEYAR